MSSLNKKAFSLIELLITITLLSIIYMFIYKSLSQNEKFLKDVQVKTKEDKVLLQLMKTLGDDIFFSKNITLKQIDKKFTEVSLNTTNSKYNIALANVKWIVEEDRLLRYESNTKISDINENMKKDIFVEKIITFKLQNVEQILSFMKFNNKKYINLFPLSSNNIKVK